jgi:hypothetical protein
MTVAEVITEVRTLVQDTRAPYRYSDAVLLRFLNQTVRRMATIRPDLFTVIGEIPTVAGTVIQRIPTTGIRLVEIYNVQGGGVITEVNKDALDQTAPMWRSSSAGVPVNYVRHVRNPGMFFLYPAPQSGTVLVAEYSETPAPYALGDTITVPGDAYIPTLINGIVYLTQSIDDEHVNSGRAKLFNDAFVQDLIADMKTQQLTDTDAGSLDPKQVV